MNGELLCFDLPARVPPQTTAALWDRSRDLQFAIEFTRRVMAHELRKPAAELSPATRSYFVRTWCADLRRYRRALREAAVVPLPRWVLQHADGDSGDLFSCSDAELQARHEWLEQLGDDTYCLHLEAGKKAQQCIEHQIARRWLENRRARKKRAA